MNKSVIRIKDELRIRKQKELMSMYNLQDRTSSNLLGASTVGLDPKTEKIKGPVFNLISLVIM
jgi:hypothetical protein